MKLLRCLSCGNIFNVDSELKHCKCKKTSGFCLFGGVYIIYSGTESICLGIDNYSTRDAVKGYVTRYKNNNMEDTPINAWLIPFGAPHTIRVLRVKKAYKIYKKIERKLNKTKNFDGMEKFKEYKDLIKEINRGRVLG